MNMPPAKGLSSQELIDEFWKAKLTPARPPVQGMPNFCLFKGVFRIEAIPLPAFSLRLHH